MERGVITDEGSCQGDNLGRIITAYHRLSPPITAYHRPSSPITAYSLSSPPIIL
ncbi:hypothetical protein [Prevotella denticola]|uniref:hypothetical protein n=1 Tax=Prevotella denticola TaxID=28129 RepID=UPI0012DF996C|nr:hypothetical protein [Prevotella denticola]